MDKKKAVNVSLYCDEVKDCRLEIQSTNEIQNWIYTGILIVPEDMSSKLFTDINNLRCLSKNPQDWRTCQINCRFHKKTIPKFITIGREIQLNIKLRKGGWTIG